MALSPKTLISHPVEDLFPFEDFSDKIENIYMFPESAAIDYKKGVFRFTESDYDAFLNYPADARIVWEFAIRFVLVDIVEQLLKRGWHFPIDSRMINELIVTPFVDDFEWSADYEQWYGCGSREEYEEFLFFTFPETKMTYFSFYGPSPKELYRMIDILSCHKTSFKHPDVMGYFYYSFINLRCRGVVKDKQQLFRKSFKSLVDTRRDYARPLLKTKTEKTIMGINQLPDDVLYYIIHQKEELPRNDLLEKAEHFSKYAQNPLLPKPIRHPFFNWLFIYHLNINLSL